MSASNDESSPTKVRVVVQGQYFLLREKLIHQFDWLLKEIYTTPMHTDKVDGVLYLDCDWSSFRLIIAWLEGNLSENDLMKLSTLELLLLSASLQYLALLEKASAIEDLISCRQSKENQQIEELARLRKDLKYYEILKKEQVEPHPIHHLNLRCSAYRTCRSGNICNDICGVVVFDPMLSTVKKNGDNSFTITCRCSENALFSKDSTTLEEVNQSILKSFN